MTTHFTGWRAPASPPLPENQTALIKRSFVARFTALIRNSRQTYRLSMNYRMAAVEAVALITLFVILLMAFRYF